MVNVRYHFAEWKRQQQQQNNNCEYAPAPGDNRCIVLISGAFPLTLLNTRTMRTTHVHGPFAARKNNTVKIDVFIVCLLLYILTGFQFRVVFATLSVSEWYRWARRKCEHLRYTECNGLTQRALVRSIDNTQKMVIFTWRARVWLCIKSTWKYVHSHSLSHTVLTYRHGKRRRWWRRWRQWWYNNNIVFTLFEMGECLSFDILLLLTIPCNWSR